MGDILFSDSLKLLCWLSMISPENICRMLWMQMISLQIFHGTSGESFPNFTLSFHVDSHYNDNPNFPGGSPPPSIHHPQVPRRIHLILPAWYNHYNPNMLASCCWTKCIMYYIIWGCAGKLWHKSPISCYGRHKLYLLYLCQFPRLTFWDHKI